MHRIKRLALFYKHFAIDNKIHTLLYLAYMGLFIYYGIWGLAVLLLFFIPTPLPRDSTAPVWPTVDVDTAWVGSHCPVCGSPAQHTHTEYKGS